MKAVMLSVRPQWCEKICHQIGTERGKPVYEKSLEVRKNRPKLETPFKCYIYCTQGEEKWLAGIIGERQSQKLNGKVIGEFVCDKMYGIYYSMYPHDPLVFEEIGTLNRPDLQEKTCLSEIEIDDYLSGNNGYGWHISALQIYDRPKELREFHFPPERYCEKELCGKCPKDQVADVNGEYEFDCEWERPLTRPPQSWCYVEAQDER